MAPQAPPGFIAWGFSVCMHSIRAQHPKLWWRKCSMSLHKEAELRTASIMTLNNCRRKS